MVKRKRKSARKLVLIALSTLSILLLAGFGLAKILDDGSGQGTTAGEDASLKPATSEEKQESESRKEEIVEEQKSQNSADSSSDIKSVTVVITEANSTGVRGYVQGIFEEGGTCTATATQGPQTITKTSTGFQNVSYTQCAPINWAPSLSGGSWTVSLSYKSAAASGRTSRAIEVN